MTFDEFLNAELTGLRRYAAMLAGDRHRAHDVLADALLAAHLGWQRIGAMEFPAAYVRRMVTSTFLSEKRRWSVRMILPTRSGALPDIPLPDPAADVDNRAQLHQLLTALPPRQRAAVVLRYYFDLPDAEISAELGITAGAVRTAISRALTSLRITAQEEVDPARAASEADSAVSADRDSKGRTDRISGPDHITAIRPRTEEGP